MKLLEPLALGGRVAPSRVVFGPHETNLARGRAVSDRHVAYYRARAAGGAGVVVLEEASVHPSDWPYERCPLASECAPGWAQVGAACHAEGALVLAALGHAGGQGSSAYSQAPLWAPSRVPEVNSREVPKWMEEGDISAVVTGFADAARTAIAAGLDGVEVNAGQHSLVRQFLSGLTNQREDRWGTDRLLLARTVLEAVRRAAGPGAVIGLRLSCDELAPWAGIVPDSGAAIAADLAGHVDYITVVRGSIFTVSATRPDTHTPPGFNLDLTRSVRAAVPASVAVIAQGSLVDTDQAEWAVAGGVCDGVEMTRAQIADRALVTKLRTGAAIRPCILCNQRCQVRDPRNPIVTCVVDPSAGYESTDPVVDPVVPAAGASGPAAGGDEPPAEGPRSGGRDGGRPLLVVGAGPAGLECARVAALRGRSVTVVDDRPEPGGAVTVAALAAGRGRLAEITRWLGEECRRLGVRFSVGRCSASDISAFDGDVVLCTGARPGPRAYEIDEGAAVVPAAAALTDGLPEGPVAVWDPIGGPIAVSVAETARSAGHEVALITPDLIAGNELSRTGDLAPANVRLLGAGVGIERRSILRRVARGSVVVEDRFTGVRRTLPAAVVVDAGYASADDELWRDTGAPRAGDAVAPRTIHEAILEGRRRALELDATEVRSAVVR
jgi:2,4-dienoyl-CoA reductase (NADPH2)